MTTKMRLSDNPKLLGEIWERVTCGEPLTPEAFAKVFSPPGLMALPRASRPQYLSACVTDELTAIRRKVMKEDPDRWRKYGGLKLGDWATLAEWFLEMADRGPEVIKEEVEAAAAEKPPPDEIHTRRPDGPLPPGVNPAVIDPPPAANGGPGYVLEEADQEAAEHPWAIAEEAKLPGRLGVDRRPRGQF